MKGIFGPSTDNESARKAYCALAGGWDRVVAKGPRLEGIKLSDFRSTVCTLAFEIERKALGAAANRTDHKEVETARDHYVVH